MSRYHIHIVLYVIFMITMGRPCRSNAQVADDSTAKAPGFFYTDHVYKPNIKTVRLLLAGGELTLPIITLNGGEKLVLSFDELGGDFENYNYTFVLCNGDWTPSDLPAFDYLGNFSEGNINDYSNSSATGISFVHYALIIPNSDVSLTKSGNYLLKIYSNNDPKQLVLTRRFYVVDNLLRIKAQIKAPGLPQYSFSHQEIQFSVFADPKVITINNPTDEISVTLMQNFRPDNAYIGVKAQYVQEDTLFFRTENKIVFPGGKEFRTFDVRDLTTPGVRVKNYVDLENTAYLFPDEIRSFKEYDYTKDANGSFIIAKTDAKNNDLNADYAKVHFQLVTNNAFPGASIYVFGGLSDWQVSNDFKLDYIAANHAYEKDILLKQGFYNYIYAYVKSGSHSPDTNLFEGNSYETENNYEILVYYRPAGGRYDQLIGINEINSIKNKEGNNKK